MEVAFLPRGGSFFQTRGIFVFKKFKNHSGQTSELKKSPHSFYLKGVLIVSPESCVTSMFPVDFLFCFCASTLLTYVLQNPPNSFKAH